MDDAVRIRQFDYCPWLFDENAFDDERTAQKALQEAIPGDTEIGTRCYVASSAAVFPTRLRLGDDSYIAAHAYVTGEVSAGSDCTINPFTVVRGRVTLGSGVRIGAHTSLLGFNHSTAPDRPVFKQAQTSVGITIGSDVWIGSHVVVVDGVTIGDHCVIGAGAVVTKDLPPWTVAAGNPARRIRDRRSSGRSGGSLSSFAAAAREQAPELLARCWDGDRYVDQPGAAPSVRAHCDAVEIADLLLGGPPPQLSAAEHVSRLAALQDPATGLVFDGPVDEDGFVGSGPALYHVLCVGYALDLLGSCFPHPIAAGMSAARLVNRLDALPWADRAWEAGAWVDSWATAAYWSGAAPGAVEALFGWLLTRVDPWTGMWGAPSAAEGRLQVVNGYYRLTRGSFAQYGVPVPHPERVVDAVLDHARDLRHFGPRSTACNVLDVAHPLWLTGRDGYRRQEIRAWAEEQLSAALARWHSGRGFAFAGGEPSLQGTEMWLAVIWHLADLVGRSDELGYRPRGVHRPEPGGRGRCAAPFV